MPLEGVKQLVLSSRNCVAKAQRDKKAIEDIKGNKSCSVRVAISGVL